MWKLAGSLSVAAAFVIFNLSPAYAVHSKGPGLMEVPLITQTLEKVGTVSIWNTPYKLRLHVRPAELMQIENLHIYVGTDPVPSTKKGNLVPGKFNYKDEEAQPGDYPLILDLEDDLGFTWDDVTAYSNCVSNGYTDCVDPRPQYIAVHVSMINFDEDGAVTSGGGSAWAYTGTAVVTSGDVDELDYPEFEGVGKGWGFSYGLSHPRKGHFVDSPVGGLTYSTPTSYGLTDGAGGFNYYRGEYVNLRIGSYLLGSTVADHKISPLDMVPGGDTDSLEVINMARLLQSLDVDATPKDGIIITREVVSAFEAAMNVLDLDHLDFTKSDENGGDEIGWIINETINQAALQGITLVEVSAEDAKAHLDETLNNAMFRKNVSKTPELGSTKAKMNIMTVWFPSMRANDELTDIEYFDEESNLIRTASEAKPIIITYTDADPVTHAMDTWAAISRDDGNTFKRKNLSRSADLSSFTLANGEEYYGYTKKPVFQVKGNKILVAWTSKFARGGKPAFAIRLDDDYTFDDPYYTEDIWGVGGPQRSIDYANEGYPEVGEVPYSAVWTCRGVITTQTDVNNGLGEFVGDIVWFKPERITSGRRDANLIFTSAASGAGFGLVWQEDPEGLRPGRAVGPGPGWGGATTNHKTDIWYSYVTWGSHSRVDANFVAGGDPEHDLDHITRPKALVPMSLPIRLSDNDVLNQKNMGIDETTYADELAYSPENLTRCVKFEDGMTIVTPESSIQDADYRVLRDVPEDHYASMNCTNCHVPYGTDPMGVTPTQGAPIPLVVINSTTNDYLGGFTNGDCISCHYSHIVPRDRLIAMTPGLDENIKSFECGSKGGIWKDGTDGIDLVEAYYPYTGYPYIFDDGSINDGTHSYGLATEGLLSGDYYTFTNHAGNETSVAITTDGRLMDGDTGASRGNLFMQPYVNAAGKTSAWAIITYEETKGAGSGPPEDTGSEVTHSDDYIPESGKNVIYHSFDFQVPDLVSAGNIMNPPEAETTMDADGNLLPVIGDITPKYLVDENGNQLLDYRGMPQLAYENARRGRFILQGAGAVKSSRTIMLMVYKMGEEGTGRPSDIMMQRWVVPTTDVSAVDNPYRFDNVQGNYVLDGASEQWYWASGPVNMSSVTPTVTTDSQGDPTSDDPWGAVKVVEWVQTEENLNDLSGTNRFDDARAHRGQLRGNFVQLGFSYTPNWAAARNGNDKYDFFIRRSFNGGVTWTTDPAGSGVTHSYTWTYPSGTQDAGTKVVEENTFAAGAFESMRNLTQLPNAKESVIEPRIVAVPGTIKAAGVWTGIPEDKQNPAVFYVAWGTSTNPKKDPVTGEQEEPVPADLYYSFSMDKGENYHEDEWVVNPDSDGNLPGETVYGFGWMAKGDQEQGEVQLRMTPDGSRFYASWLDEGQVGSDIIFRRIMSADFPANNASGISETTTTAPEEEAGSVDDFSSDSGGGDD